MKGKHRMEVAFMLLQESQDATACTEAASIDATAAAGAQLGALLSLLLLLLLVSRGRTSGRFLSDLGLSIPCHLPAPDRIRGPVRQSCA